MLRQLVLTHSDLDGMVSAILLLTKLGPETEITITNASKLAESIRQETARECTMDVAYICDIPLDRIRVDDVYAVLDALNRRQTPLHLYDHHKGWNDPVNGRFKPLFTTYVVDETKTTAAALVWRDFLNRDESCRRWLELLSKKDGSADQSVVDDFHLLAALMQPRYARRKRGIIHLLASGNGIEDRGEIVKWYVSQYLPREQMLVEKAEILETSGGRRVGWLDLRFESCIYPGISKRVIAGHDVDLVANVIYSGVVLGGESIDRGIDLSFMHGYQEVDGVGIEVVGHKNPVRLRPVDGTVDDAFVMAAKNLIVDRL